MVQCIKGEAIRLLGTNSSKTTFEESLVTFKQRLRVRGYLKTIIERSLSRHNVASKPSDLPFVTTYHPAVNSLKQTMMEHWGLIQNQPLLITMIYLKPPIISYKRGKSVKDLISCMIQWSTWSPIQWHEGYCPIEWCMIQWPELRSNDRKNDVWSNDMKSDPMNWKKRSGRKMYDQMT